MEQNSSVSVLTKRQPLKMPSVAASYFNLQSRLCLRLNHQTGNVQNKCRGDASAIV